MSIGLKTDNILTDSGPEFRNQKVKILCDQHQIKHYINSLDYKNSSIECSRSIKD